MIRPKARKSPIWKPSRDEFQKICSENSTLSDIITSFGLKPSGNYKILKQRIEEDKIDVSHISLGLHSNGSRKGRYWRGKNVYTLDEILVENSSYGSLGSLKKRLFKEGVWSKYECSICGISTWNGKGLVLRLDHINGVHNDHRIENLRLVCPNCDSQLPTFSKGSRGLIS